MGHHYKHELSPQQLAETVELVRHPDAPTPITPTDAKRALGDMSPTDIALLFERTAHALVVQGQ